MTASHHFILSNRKVYSAFGKKYFHIENNIPPGLPLHYTYSHIPTRSTARSRIIDPVIGVDENFIDEVLRAGEGLKNVTLFIHGFHHLFDLSFKLDVFSMLAAKYCCQHHGVGKFIFFSWPSTQSRHYLDDRAHAHGVMLYRNYAGLFEQLCAALNGRGVEFNLMVHSMGHRLLNGFLAGANGSKKYFNKVFLFAPDVPHKTLDNNLPGVIIRNRLNSIHDGATREDDEQRHYNFSALSWVADEVHCYYYRYDRILFAGVAAELKRREEVDPGLVDDCLSLGNLGGERISSFENVTFHNVKPMLRQDAHFSSFLIKNIATLKKLEGNISSNEIRDRAKLFAAMKSLRNPWVKLHRYFVECDAVVQDVCQKLGGKVSPLSP